MGMEDFKHRSADAPWLDGYIDTLELFRTHSKDVTVNQVLTFLYVAREPGITQTETLTKLGLAVGGSSRIVAALSKYGDRSDHPGWNVVNLEENPNDRRYKLLTLTSKGIGMVNAIKASLARVARNLPQHA
jgi:DNA-binding MarR family transcriptional regulator